MTQQDADRRSPDAPPYLDPPLVSVIMPFLNAGRFIEEAIGSVRAQSYGRWELLLVDDGSTDEGTAIARRHAAADPGRVRYLEHPGHANRGASAARNLGLRHAGGELVAFLDADDVWLPAKLEAHVRVMAEHPEASMVYGPTEYWYSWTGDPDDAARDDVPSLGCDLDRLYPPASLFDRMFLRVRMTAPCTCSLLARRTAIDRIGGFEDAFRRVYTDQVFYAKMFLHEPVYVASGCHDRYRQHAASSVHVAQREGRLDATRGQFLNWLEGYLRDGGWEGTPLWHQLRREQFPYRFPALAAAARSARLATRLPARAARKAYRTARRLAGHGPAPRVHAAPTMAVPPAPPTEIPGASTDTPDA